MTHDINRHLDDGNLEKYSMGDLLEIEAAGFEEHLLTCEHCQQRLAEADDYVLSMQRAAAQLRGRLAHGPAVRRASWWNPIRLVPALAAAALLVLMLGWWSAKSDVPWPSPFALSLVATRSSGTAVYAPAGAALQVRLDLTGLPELASYRLEMVDAAGGIVWQSAAAARDATVEANIPGTRAGVYFIRVYSPAAELLREFGLKIRNR